MDAALLTPVQADLNTLTAEQSAILKTLLYFDLFQHPLLLSEIKHYCQHQILDEKLMKKNLDLLISKKYIFQIRDYYSLSAEADWVTKRQEGNIRAKALLEKARPYIKLISVFPFVRAVFISGSVSKGFADKKGDVDYFIITHPGRLWVCRTLLMLFKKVFLLNSRKFFCINYFIDSDNLTIPDQNLFTATEIAFLKPVYNPDLCRLFFSSNDWKTEFYPDMPLANMEQVLLVNRSWIKRAGEWLFRSKAGAVLDRYFLLITLRHWRRKFSGLPPEAFELSFRSTRNVSKHHPRNFQQTILDSYRHNLQVFLQTHGISLHP
ncbi:MAG TPA: nucleotidyltransferase domain-containing protein [Bacteroidia bacterium]|jgi:hypothetical protein|nr:nucleotidyltransferase domain-containing protein [Bacteroidia bacterium]